MLEVRLSAVRVDLASQTPVIFLQEASGERSLPIFIGAAEATAIAYAMQHMSVPRPMTHDLLRDVVDALGATVQHVVVTEIRDATYYAELHLQRAGALIVVSARPSDAVALAARTGSPIYVADDLMDASGVVLEEDDEDEEEEEASEEIVGEFLEFLDNVRPEDFSG